jgi:hypothetical protein
VIADIQGRSASHSSGLQLGPGRAHEVSKAIATGVALLIARPEDRPLCCSTPAGTRCTFQSGCRPGDHDQGRPTWASRTHHPPPPARKNRTRSPVASTGDRFVGQVVVWADALTLRTSSVPAPLRPVPAPLTGLLCCPGQCDPLWPTRPTAGWRTSARLTAGPQPRLWSGLRSPSGTGPAFPSREAGVRWYHPVSDRTVIQVLTSSVRLRSPRSFARPARSPRLHVARLAVRTSSLRSSGSGTARPPPAGRVDGVLFRSAPSLPRWRSASLRFGGLIAPCPRYHLSV